MKFDEYKNCFNNKDYKVKSEDKYKIDFLY